MKISCNFDSGNIEVISLQNPSNIQLAIRKDNLSDFYQWFHFRLYTPELTSVILRITNAATSAYPDGWKDYQAVASYDRQTWFRVETEFDSKELIIKHTPEQHSIYFAYFAPYSYERHQDLLHKYQTQAQCQLLELGETLDGRDISLLVAGKPDATKAKIWITARQHPGETMAQWYTEGLLHRLFDQHDAISRTLLQKAVFYIVPNMNPDGSVRGHLRTNAVGVNLNREWLNPTQEKSPEVYFVREKMLETGVDMYLDIHGDENLPYNFVAGAEGIPSYNPHLHRLQEDFKTALLGATAEFQVVHGYAKDATGQANLTVASNWVAEQFNCLSYTVEMPFKDNADLPDTKYGWSDKRSEKLGQATLTAILAVADKLR